MPSDCSAEKKVPTGGSCIAPWHMNTPFDRFNFAGFVRSNFGSHPLQPCSS